VPPQVGRRFFIANRDTTQISCTKPQHCGLNE